jgi:hypothetical protein
MTCRAVLLVGPLSKAGFAVGKALGQRGSVVRRTRAVLPYLGAAKWPERAGGRRNFFFESYFQMLRCRGGQRGDEDEEKRQDASRYPHQIGLRRCLTGQERAKP